jgi:hypothetical protein
MNLLRYVLVAGTLAGLGSFCISSLPKNMKSAFSHENHILLLRPLRLGNPNRARR